MILRHYVLEVMNSIISEYNDKYLTFISISDTMIVYSYIDENHVFIETVGLSATLDIIESVNESVCIPQD